MSIEEQPNILVILSDQLRRDVLGIYGDPNISTPNIDRLGSEGVRFQHACSTFPVCVPFRFTLMTGEYAHSRYVPAIDWRMSPAERTIADEFNEAGYETIYVGKWHLFGEPGQLARRANLTPIPPEHQGRWQKWLGFEFANNPFDTYYFEDDDPIPKALCKYQTDSLFELTMDYLNKRNNTEKPYFCVLSVEPPHYPLQSPKDLEKKWLKKSVKLPPNYLFQDKYPAPGMKLKESRKKLYVRDLKKYYSMVENLDINVGRMLDFIEKMDQKDDTIIVLMSDHGEMGGAHCIRNILKGHPYEESIGIPLIVYDPRKPNQSGQIIREPVCTEDLFPTLLGLAGLEPKEKKPGMDLTPLIHGKQKQLPREGILLEFVHDTRCGTFPSYNEKTWRGFHSRGYKYTVLGDEISGGKPWQFYNIENDPYEMENLIDNPHYTDEIIRHHMLLREKLMKTSDSYVLAAAFGIEGLNLWK